MDASIGSPQKRSFDEMNQESEFVTVTDINITAVDINPQAATPIDLCNDENDDIVVAEMEINQQPQPVVFAEPPKKRRKIDMENLSTLGKLALNPAYSDVNFLVGGVRSHGIKAIFASKCPKFADMFFPAGKYISDPVHLEDITSDAFEFIRDHINEMNPEMTAEIVVDVLSAVKIGYDDHDGSVRKQCFDFLGQINNADDFLSVLGQFGLNRSMIDEVNELLASHFELLRSNGNEIISSEKWKSLPFWVVRQVMQSDNLAVNEDQLFQESIWWIKTDKEELKQCIRFCRMDTEYIFNEIKNHGILSDADLVSLYEMKLGLTNDCVFNCAVRFEAKKRKTPKSKKSPKAKKTPKAKKSAKAKRTATKKKTKKAKEDAVDESEAAEEDKKLMTKAKPKGRATRKSSRRKR